MPLHAAEVEVTVEREVPPTDDRAGRSIRLTARLEPSSPGVLPTPEELREAIETLNERIDAALDRGGPIERGPERELDELVETYRPRQKELVELLRAEGELSNREASLLRQHMASRSPVAAGGPVDVRVDAGSSGRGQDANRTVEELIATYQIASLKQAGAVRARRQISFAEYMALKKHFSTPESPAPDARTVS